MAYQYQPRPWRSCWTRKAPARGTFLCRIAIVWCARELSLHREATPSAAWPTLRSLAPGKSIRPRRCKKEAATTYGKEVHQWIARVNEALLRDGVALGPIL